MSDDLPPDREAHDMSDDLPPGREADEAELLDALDPEPSRDSLIGLLTRRARGAFVLDEWGFDQDLVAALTPLTHLRWSFEVDGVEYLPAAGPALVMINQRMEPLSPMLAALALREATRRAVRFSGVPDLAPIGPVLRRLGGVHDGLDDLRSLLKGGEVVVRSFQGSLADVVGLGDPETGPLGVALALGVPVVPVHLSGGALGRRRRLLVGAPILTRRRARPTPARGWHDAQAAAAAASTSPASAASADGLAETLRRRMVQLADAP